MDTLHSYFALDLYHNHNIYAYPANININWPTSHVIQKSDYLTEIKVVNI